MRTWFSLPLVLGALAWLGAPAATGQQRDPPIPVPSYGTDPNPHPVRPVFISGKVVLDDGSAPLQPIKIERLCGVALRLESLTNSKGRFRIEVGRNQTTLDASENPVGLIRDRGPGTQPVVMRLPGMQPERRLLGCELRVTLPGFRPESVPLRNIHYLDTTDIGTLVLHRIAKVDGLTVSATLALAPKDAKKAFERGQEAVTKRNTDEAQKNFQRSVELYPAHAAAWYELGKIQEQRDHGDEALKSYEQAIAADSKFIPPYLRVAALAMRASKWREVADYSEQVLKLDPVDYADVYYVDSVAQLELNNVDDAEKRAREAIRLDSTKELVRACYILGLAQARKHDFAAAALSLRTFLENATAEDKTELIRNQLVQAEHAADEQASQRRRSEPPASQAPTSDPPLSR